MSQQRPVPARATDGHGPFARRLHRRRWLLFAVALAVAASGWLVADVLRIKGDLQRGRDELLGLDLLTIDDAGGIGFVVDRAAARLESADRLANRSLPLRALSLLPGVGGQIDAVRDLTGTVADIGGAARTAAASIQTALDGGSGPRARLEITQVAGEQLRDLRVVLEEVSLPGGWLVPPIDDARSELQHGLERARRDLADGAELVAALEQFLRGPRRYLILGGNNAEMRSGGIPTTSGIATVDAGTITTGDFSGATEAIELPEPGVPVPPAYEDVYGWLEGNRGYRTTTASANWPVTARIMADITAANVYGRIDGIIFLDTIALSYLLDVVGPVTVEGRDYSSENVIEELLYRNYLEFPTLAESVGRRELQSKVANAAFDALNERDFSLTKLAGVLSRLAEYRSLLAWSADPEENELWIAFGAHGALDPDNIGVISNQLNASKLDYFSYLEVDLTATTEDAKHHIVMTIRLVNPEHPETSPYIDGGGLYADPGEVGSFLVVYLPQGATTITNEEPGISHAGQDGGTYAVGMILRVPEGETEEVTVEFDLPMRPEQTLRVVPSSRLTPTRWTVGGDAGHEGQGLEIRLDEDGATLVRRR